ncbi:MAG: putative metal-binding motif-containing protein [Alphaproteobacteria bacterium]|nr:putative metal-binding motif-containing protein [Alphaproteobacteria bacterium]
MRLRATELSSLLRLALCLLSTGCMGRYVDPPSPDEDGDGFTAREDCDDAQPAVYPGAPELCGGVDEDCDGRVDEELQDQALFFRDIDGDGHGDEGAQLLSCDDAVAGWASVAGDCDDRDRDTHPGADEACDDLDNDCDGAVDEDPVGAPTWYPDVDDDGFGDAEGAQAWCSPPEGWVREAGDCDDAEASAHAGADEICDDLDNDCDGLVDGADPDVDLDTRRTFTVDRDGDGYGARGGAWLESCSQPSGYAESADDCDDTDADVHPNAVEVWYDGTDGDCDGGDDDDADGDGWALGEDCDDADSGLNPGAAEVWYDGVDADCAEDDDDDADADGFAGVEAGGDDCDDQDPAVHPFAWEDEGDGVDNDCDGAVDLDDPEVPVALHLEEDGWASVTLDSPVSLCGESWTTLWVGADGLVQLSGATLDDGESAAEFLAAGPVVAALWDDFNPADGGEIAWVERSGGLSVYWRGVYETVNAGGDNTFAATLLADGRVYMEHEAVAARDGLAGWSCGVDSGAAEQDLSALPYVPGSVGRGQGTEAAVFEIFTGGDNDLDGSQLMLCGWSGLDADGDGWTDQCGDPDDSDASVTP